MEENLFKAGMIQFGIFLLTSIIIARIVFWYIKRFINKKYNIVDRNTACNIFYSGIVFSVFYLLSGMIVPVTTTMKLLQSNNSWLYAFNVSKFVSIFIFIGIISAYLVYIISLRIMYYYFKEISVLTEVKNNNIGISILMTIIIVSFSLMTKDGLITLFESFVPYPEMPNLLH